MEINFLSQLGAAAESLAAKVRASEPPSEPKGDADPAEAPVELSPSPLPSDRNRTIGGSAALKAHTGPLGDCDLPAAPDATIGEVASVADHTADRQQQAVSSEGEVHNDYSVGILQSGFTGPTFNSSPVVEPWQGGKIT